MRVIIYGAGAIGGVVGGYLERVEHDVLLIGRPGLVKTVREHGLRLVTPDGTHVLHPAAVTTPDQIDVGPDDVVFLCMKGQDTEGALRDLRAVVEDVPIFCLQNGVRNEEFAAQCFPKVYGVEVRIGAVFLDNDEVVCRRDPPGWLMMGCYPAGTDDLVEAVAANLRTAGFFVLVTPDVMPHKWAKLLRNLANAIGAITDARGDDVARIAEAARQEAQEILAQAGIRWVSEEELAQEWPEITVQPRGRLDTKAQSSTWQSLTRRTGSIETDFLNGEIVRLAKQMGRRAPVNETLLYISQEMAVKQEPPGKYTPAQLLRLVGLG